MWLSTKWPAGVYSALCTVLLGTQKSVTFALYNTKMVCYLVHGSLPPCFLVLDMNDMAS